MNDVDESALRALERWRVSGAAPAWEDVLARAGPRAPQARVVRPRVALALAGVVVAVVAAVPAVGIGSQLLSRRGPDAVLFASARGASGSMSFEAAMRNTFVVQAGPRGRFLPARKLRQDNGGILLRPGATLAWKLTYRGERDLAAARIRAGERSVGLCAPCDARSSGTSVLGRPLAVAVFNGGGVVELRTSAGTLTGRISFNPRSRRGGAKRIEPRRP